MLKSKTDTIDIPGYHGLKREIKGLATKDKDVEQAEAVPPEWEWEE
jgi:hypothetical protein